VSHESPTHDFQAIRKLLTSAFTADQLRRFCLDRPLFRPVCDEFSPAHGLNELVDRVIIYCEKQDLFDELLTGIQEHNPGWYAKFEPQLRYFTPGERQPASASSNPWEKLKAWWGRFLHRYWPLAALIAIVGAVFFAAQVYNALTGKAFLDLFRRATPTPISTATVIPPKDPGQIAFASGPIGQREVYIMEIDGSGQINMTNDKADDWYPAWSWDRQHLAFVSDRDGNQEIYSMDVDTKAVTRLTTHDAHDRYPSWAPDGLQIAFTSARDGNEEIYVLDAGSLGTTRLTDNPADDAYPSWSPDGARITFASNRDGDWEIYLMSADGKDLVNLTNNGENDWEPAWSPDGTQIAFATDRDGNLEIYVLDVESRGVTRLTNNQRYDWLPSWTQDGHYILFLAGPSQEEGDAYRMNADGSGEICLTGN
jgi:Tol biopolymer transport system component